MKRLFIATLTILSLQASAQDKKHIVSLSPLGLINKVKIKYEYVIDSSFTIGTFGAYHYGMIYEGTLISPMGRYYFKKKAPEGFYLQAKLFSGYFNSDDPFKMFLSIDSDFICVGGGIGIGKQILIGPKNNIALDSHIGIKYGTGPPLIDYYRPFWYRTGPGSIFDGLISTGIIF